MTVTYSGMNMQFIGVVLNIYVRETYLKSVIRTTILSENSFVPDKTVLADVLRKQIFVMQIDSTQSAHFRW